VIEGTRSVGDCGPLARNGEFRMANSELLMANGGGTGSSVRGSGRAVKRDGRGWKAGANAPAAALAMPRGVFVALWEAQRAASPESEDVFRPAS